MSGIFLTINTAKRGMFAVQQGIQTAGHNIANADTDGFSRQRVELVTTPGYRIPGAGLVGTGVDISTIARVRDAYLDTQIRYESSIAGQYKARQETLEQVEMTFMEPGENGLNTYIGKMWDAWQDLGDHPENPNTRILVRENARTLTDNMNHLYRRLDTLKSDSIHLEEKSVQDVHSILTQVRNLNRQISRIRISGEQPNDLLDQRDLLLDQLSGMIDFSSSEDKYGQVTITHSCGPDSTESIELLGTQKGSEIKYEMAVVRSVERDSDGMYHVSVVRGGSSPGGAETLTLSEEEYQDSGLTEGAVLYDERPGEAIVSKDLKPLPVSGGSLKGYPSVSQEISGYQDQLDGLARAIAYTVNTVHTTKLNGEKAATKYSFFVGDGGSDDPEHINAGNITVNPEIMKDASRINAGKMLDGGLPGNGDRALSIARLRNVRLPIQEFMDDPIAAARHLDENYQAGDMQFDPVAGGSTIEGYFKDIIAELGVSSQEAVKMGKNQDALTNQLIQRRYSVSGVSIDEEITSLIQLQHVYQANANVLSTLTTMLDTLINRMGV